MPWDASNSFSLPTKASGDDSVPMDVDYVGKEKGKKGCKKGSDAKGKNKGKFEGKGSWKGQSHEKGKSTLEKSPWKICGGGARALC